MRRFAEKAFRLLSGRIYHVAEVLPEGRAVRLLLSGGFVCYAGPSGLPVVPLSLSFLGY